MFAAFHDQFPLLTIRIKPRLEMEIKKCKFCIQKFWHAEYWNVKIWNAEYRNFNRKLFLLPFLIWSLFFSQGILDYLDNLTVTQIRKLFSMLSTLAFTNQQDGGLIQVICNKNGAWALMYCRQVKTRQGNVLFGVLNSPMYIDWGSVGAVGGVLTKFYTGRLSRGPTPYPFIYDLWQKGSRFIYLLLTDSTPFTDLV